MGHLSASVLLGDVRDVDAFVCAIVSRHPVLSQLRGHERDEIEAEGYAIMLELERDWNPDVGTFSGYARRYLAGRLLDARHRWRRGEEIREHGPGPRRFRRQVIASWEAEIARPGFSEVGLRRVGEFARVPAV